MILSAQCPVLAKSGPKDECRKSKPIHKGLYEIPLRIASSSARYITVGELSSMIRNRNAP
jgi:hypothetical protein